MMSARDNIVKSAAEKVVSDSDQDADAVGGDDAGAELIERLRELYLADLEEPLPEELLELVERLGNTN